MALPGFERIMARLTSKQGKYTEPVLRAIWDRRKSFPIDSTELKVMIGVNDATVRAIVSEARVRGAPIGSNQDGYFLAWTEDELESTFAHLDGRMIRISRAKSGMLSAFDNNGQLRLDGV